MQPDTASSEVKPKARFYTWLKRLGVVGFLFFLIKGLLWLALPGVLAYFGLSG